MLLTKADSASEAPSLSPKAASRSLVSYHKQPTQLQPSLSYTNARSRRNSSSFPRYRHSNILSRKARGWFLKENFVIVRREGLKNRPKKETSISAVKKALATNTARIPTTTSAVLPSPFQKQWRPCSPNRLSLSRSRATATPRFCRAASTTHLRCLGARRRERGGDTRRCLRIRMRRWGDARMIMWWMLWRGRC
jgi:hypothetical protein